MAQFLSQEWVDQVNEAAEASDAFRTATANVQFTMQQVVTSGPDGDVKYYFKIDKGDVATGLGELDGPDVTITQDYDTAAAMFRGDINTQQAFMSGKIRVSGNMALMLQHQAALGGLDAVFQKVRETTTY